MYGSSLYRLYIIYNWGQILFLYTQTFINVVLNTTSFHEPAECNECKTRDRVVLYLRVTALESDQLGAGLVTTTLQPCDLEQVIGPTRPWIFHQ